MMLAVGLVSLAFGIFGIVGDPEMEGGGAMLLGMFTGFGGVMMLVSIIRLIYLAVASAGKLKAAEICVKDERNVMLQRTSYTVSNAAASLMFAVMAFVFVGMGYRVPAYIAVVALWVQAVVFLIAHRVLSKKL
jgi:hypothetical protein